MPLKFVKVLTLIILLFFYDFNDKTLLSRYLDFLSSRDDVNYVFLIYLPEILFLMVIYIHNYGIKKINCPLPG